MEKIVKYSFASPHNRQQFPYPISARVLRNQTYSYLGRDAPLTSLWLNECIIHRSKRRAVSLNFSQGCLPGSAHVYGCRGCPVMDDLGARWRKTPSNWWRVRCLFQHKCSPREQAFSILSTGHGVERVNSAALIDQSGFSRWIQFWIIFSSMVNLPLLSKYIRLIEMFKGSTLGCGVCTSVRQVVCAAFMVWW